MQQSRVDLLRRLEAYYDAVPRHAARAEDHGPLTLFVNRRPGWPYYARPRLGDGTAIGVEHVEAVRLRQRGLRIPEAFEWVAEVTPSLRPAAEAAGLDVQEHPLMVLDVEAFATVRDGLSDLPGLDVRIVHPEVPDLAVLRAVAEVGFSERGTQVGAAGAEAAATAARHQDPEALVSLRERLRSGLTVMAAGRDGEAPLAVGSHQPVGDVTEVVGVATLPAARRRGLGTAITRTLVADSLRRGCTLVFLSADDDAVARMYARLGFRRAGTALIAEPRR